MDVIIDSNGDPSSLSSFILNDRFFLIELFLIKLFLKLRRIRLEILLNLRIFLLLRLIWLKKNTIAAFLNPSSLSSFILNDRFFNRVIFD